MCIRDRGFGASLWGSVFANNASERKAKPPDLEPPDLKPPDLGDEEGRSEGDEEGGSEGKGGSEGGLPMRPSVQKAKQVAQQVAQAPASGSAGSGPGLASASADSEAAAEATRVVVGSASAASWFDESADVASTWDVASWDSNPCLLYTSPSPRDATLSRMPSSP